MKTFSFVAVALCSLFVASQAFGADAGSKVPTEGKTNTICPVTGKAVDPAVTWEYEGLTWSFAADGCRAKFKAAQEASLYHRLGGKAAIDAAVEAFYVKVLADKRVNHYFADVNMTKQRKKQKAFLSAAFGGPIPWTGKDMRTAHADLHLSEGDFNAIAENLKSTLEDLKIKKELIDEVLAIAVSVKGDVLNRTQTSK